MDEVWFAILTVAGTAFFGWGAWRRHQQEQEFRRWWAQIEKDLDG